MWLLTLHYTITHIQSIHNVLYGKNETTLQLTSPYKTKNTRRKHRRYDQNTRHGGQHQGRSVQYKKEVRRIQ